MTTDVVAVTITEPDEDSLLHALSCIASKTVEHAGGGAMLRILGPGNSGSGVMTVAAPLHVRVPGEVARMTGGSGTLPEAPVWWTELRSHQAPRFAYRVGGAFAGRLVTRLGGAVWPPKARVVDPEEPVRIGISQRPPAQQPAIDLVTPLTATVMQDRPVVGVTHWLLDALRGVLMSDPPRTLCLITPPHTRLTLPLYELLATQPIQWVVLHGAAYYDGRTGSVLDYTDKPMSGLSRADYSERRTPDGRPVVASSWHDSEAPYLDDPDDSGRRVSKARAFAGTPERRLSLHLHTRHAATSALRLGGAVEAIWQAVTGRSPAGWGTAEPVENLWAGEELTAAARSRAPEPTFFVVVGHPDQPAIGSLRVARTPEGVEETVSVTFGFRDGQRMPDQRRLSALAEKLIRLHGLSWLRVSHRAASADLLVAPLFQGVPAPLGMAIGPDAATAAAHQIPPTLPHRPVRVGSAERSGLYFPFDGTTAAWRHLRTISEWLQPGPGWAEAEAEMADATRATKTEAEA